MSEFQLKDLLRDDNSKMATKDSDVKMELEQIKQDNADIKQKLDNAIDENGNLKTQLTGSNTRIEREVFVDSETLDGEGQTENFTLPNGDFNELYVSVSSSEPYDLIARGLSGTGGLRSANFFPDGEGNNAATGETGSRLHHYNGRRNADNYQKMKDAREDTLTYEVLAGQSSSRICRLENASENPSVVTVEIIKVWRT